MTICEWRRSTTLQERRICGSCESRELSPKAADVVKRSAEKSDMNSGFSLLASRSSGHQNTLAGIGDCEWHPLSDYLAKAWLQCMTED